MNETLKTKGAAALLGKSVSWLNKARVDGDGPPYYQIGRSVVYRRAEVEAWLERHRRHSTTKLEA